MIIPHSLERARLRLLIHLAGFRLAPGAYLTAAKWRILRKRVRARGQFAALLAKTSRAYDWWVLTKESALTASPLSEPPIIALIDTAEGAEGLEATLASTNSEGIESQTVNRAAIQQDMAAVAAFVSANPDAWLMPIQAGDTIAPGAARAYRGAIESDQPMLIYADDDLVDRNARRSVPHFKPDWNPELFDHHDYLTGACVVRAEAVDLEAAARKADWAAALVEQALAAGGAPTHMCEMLHHRRARPEPAVQAPAVPPVQDLPRVTVIVPTRNRVDLLATCIEGLRATRYPSLEVIVVDNDSDDPETLNYLEAIQDDATRVLRHPGAFNYSQINNRAVDEASGELICLLNNDIEIRDPAWLQTMAVQAMRDDVGAVGAQLLYPDGRVQHAGVVVGVGNAAGHAHRLLHPSDRGYFRRHTLPQFATAVTAACLVVKRERFLAVGGLDEDNFRVAFNDVDLCLKLNQRGWQSFYEPRAVLVHHESVSRGLDKDKAGAARFASELAALQRRWATDQITDPYHHPELSRATEQFSVGLHNV